MPNTIVLAGGSGFVGQALAESLLNDGLEVRVLTRGKPSKIKLANGARDDAGAGNA